MMNYLTINYLSTCRRFTEKSPIPTGDSRYPWETPPEIPTGDPSEGRVPEWAVWTGGPGAGLVCTQLFRVNYATFFEGIWENA